MATVARETLQGLAQMVADLLRRPNSSDAAETWVNKAVHEIYTRTSGGMARRQAVFQLATAGSAAGSFDVAAVPNGYLSPLSLKLVKADNKFVYAPDYVDPIEFFQTASWRLAETTGIPERWTIQRAGDTEPTATLTDMRTWKMYVDPAIPASTTYWAYLVYLTAPVWQTDPLGYLEVYPHWEYAVVWQAAAIGARVLREQTAPIFASEAERAVRTLIAVEELEPDHVPMVGGQTVLGIERYKQQIPTITHDPVTGS